MSKPNPLHNTLRRRLTRAVCICIVVGGAAHLEASCGDYVKIGNPRSHNTPDEMADAVSSTAGKRSQPRPPLPCHGPGCRRDLPSPHAPVPPVPRIQPVKEWLVVRGTDDEASDLCCLLPDESAAHVRMSSDRIDRPPRRRA